MWDVETVEKGGRGSEASRSRRGIKGTLRKECLRQSGHLGVESETRHQGNMEVQSLGYYILFYR